MTKYLGVDYGTKKIGIAISDDSGTLAFPNCVLQNTSKVHTQIKELAKENGITQIVIGHSLAHDGSENPVMELVHLFKKELENDGFKVYLEPEYLTTFQAKRMSDDVVADASAAALILQSFIDSSAGFSGEGVETDLL